MHTIENALESENYDDYNLEMSYSDGVLKIYEPNQSRTWVLNKHGATRQIWLSSPLTGPSKYNFHRNLNEKRWRNERDTYLSLYDKMKRDFEDALGIDPEFENDF